MDFREANVIDIDAVNRSDMTNYKTCKICRVDKRAYRSDQSLYGPSIVSIGPYHHGTTIVSAMEKEKWVSFGYLLEKNSEEKIVSYTNIMREIEERVRISYSEEIKMNKEKFVKMLLLDASFLLRLIDEKKEQEEGGTNYIRTMKLKHDLLLMENQIPYFVLRELYKQTGSDETKLAGKVVDFLESIIHCYPKGIGRPREFHNLLHLCHMYFRPTHINNPDLIQIKSNIIPTLRNLECLSRAVEYNKIGLQIKKKEFDENNPHSLVDISFENNVLEIPMLTIDMNTAALFRSLVAFEQSNPEFGDDFMVYIAFMYRFISEPEDVNLLIRKGILVHYLFTDNEVLELFWQLGNCVYLDYFKSCYLDSVCRQMDKHAKHRTRRLSWTRLREPRFGLPFIILAIFVICFVSRELVTIIMFLRLQ